MPTKELFLQTYQELITLEYGWARDNKPQLEKFMDSVHTTLYTEKNTWNIDSPMVTKAWRAIGMSGKPTYKSLRGLQ